MYVVLHLCVSRFRLGLVPSPNETQGSADGAPASPSSGGYGGDVDSDGDGDGGPHEGGAHGAAVARASPAPTAAATTAAEVGPSSEQDICPCLCVCIYERVRAWRCCLRFVFFSPVRSVAFRP